MTKVSAAGLLFLAMLLVHPMTVLADWDKIIGGDGLDQGRSVEQTTDGGYIIAGYTTSYGAGGYDVWLIKTDANGIEEWNQTFGGTGDDFGESVQQTSDGGYIIAAYTDSYGAGQDDIWLIKTYADGSYEWGLILGGTDWDRGYEAQQTDDGGYAITGYVTLATGTSYAILIKADSNGDLEWYKIYGGAGVDYGNSVRQTSDGGYIIAGQTTSFGTGNWDGWLIKTDGSGNLEWDQIFGGENSDYANCVRQTDDGGYIIAGRYGATEYAYITWLIKTDAGGDEEWSTTLLGREGHSVVQTTDGGYMVAGYRYVSPQPFHSIVVKTDSLGNVEWDRTFNDGIHEEAYSVQQTTDGNYILVGYTYSVNWADSDVWLIKTMPPELSQINLFGPPDTLTQTSPPTFYWTPDGGTINRFVVDLHIPGLVPLWTGPVIATSHWSMPPPIWGAISPGSHVYWRVRGANLDEPPPLSILTSDEVWSFYK